MSHIKAMQEKGEKDPNSEFYYYPFFQKWLWNRIKDTGRDHKLLTTLQFTSDCSREFDIIAGYKHKNTLKYTLFAIEVKMVDFMSCFHQARNRTNFCDYSYLAFPYKNGGELGYVLGEFAKHYSWMKQFGLGFLIYDTGRKKVLPLLEATKSKTILEKYRRKLIDLIWYNNRALESEKKIQLTDFIENLERDKK